MKPVSWASNATWFLFLRGAQRISPLPCISRRIFDMCLAFSFEFCLSFGYLFRRRSLIIDRFFFGVWGVDMGAFLGWHSPLF